MGKFIDLTGKRFGKLLVISRSIKKYGRTYWSCKCDCGNEKAIVGHSLKIGHTKSCGCLHTEQLRKQLTTHGMSKTRIFHIWCAMRRRCIDSKQDNYSRYGGQGITVCKRWQKFENFYEDMKDGYANNLSIDRIDNNKGYYKENCKWSTAIEQRHNQKRFSRLPVNP